MPHEVDIPEIFAEGLSNLTEEQRHSVIYLSKLRFVGKIYQHVSVHVCGTDGKVPKSYVFGITEPILV